MNSSENDRYWNESKLSKFNFEQDDNKNLDPFFDDDIIDTAKRFAQESTSYAFGFNQNIQFESVTNYLSETCISCILGHDNEKNELSLYRNLPLDEEVRLLRRHIKNRWCPPSIEGTLNNIFLGLPYSFELYRSFQDKKDLLKSAVKSADGDAILAVVVYLVKTLKKSLVYQLLMKYPAAVSHYVHYLYTCRQTAELNDLLEALGRSKEVMIKQLSIATQNPLRLHQRLRLLLKNYSFETGDLQLIENYAKLVDWQTAVSKSTSDPIIGESAVYSLEYCILKKVTVPLPCNEKTESQGNTSNFAKCFGVSEKQTLVTLMRANAELQQWDAIEQLLVVKGWVGGKKLNTNLPTDKLLEELQKYGAPTSLLDSILALIVDSDRRTEIARKLGRHVIVIEALNKKRDKGGLLQYMATLDSQSADYFYAENILQSMGSRWKN